MSLIRMLFASILVFAIFAAPGRAGEAAKANREILSDTIRANKKALVAVNLRLTDEEAARFWPVYDRYQKDLAGVQDRLVKVIDDYTASFRNLSDEKAMKLVEDYLAAGRIARRCAETISRSSRRRSPDARSRASIKSRTKWTPSCATTSRPRSRLWRSEDGRFRPSGTAPDRPAGRPASALGDVRRAGGGRPLRIRRGAARGPGVRRDRRPRPLGHGPLQAIAALRRRHGLTRDPADRASLRAGPGTARHRPTSRSPAVANVPGERDASRWRQMARPSPARRLTCARSLLSSALATGLAFNRGCGGDDHENVDRDRHRPDARARLVSRARVERLSRRPELRPVREQLPGPLPAVPGELPVLTVTGTGPRTSHRSS